MIDWLRDPHNRVRSAWFMLWASLAGWAGTHALLVLTKPPELDSWAGHLLLALSWLAVTTTALNIIITTDVRREQQNGESG